MKKTWRQLKKRYNQGKIVRALQSYVISLEGDLQSERQISLRSQKDVHRLQILGLIKQSVLVEQTPIQFANNTFNFLQELIAYDHASVILFDYDNNRGRVLATHGAAGFNIQPNALFALDDCFANVDAVVTGYSVLDQASLSPQPACYLDTLVHAAGAQSYLSLLLISHNEVIGSLNLAAYRPEAFDKTAISIARDVANSLAVAIQKNNLLEQSRNKTIEFESMTKLATELRRAESYNEIIYILIGETTHVANAAVGGFLWFEEEQIRCICTTHDTAFDHN